MSVKKSVSILASIRACCLIVLCGILMPNFVFSAESLDVNGKTRSMIVHAPTGVAANQPLVISLHGMGQSAEYQQSTTGWNDVADAEGFVVVYPSTVGQTWDIGGTSDLDFIKAIIANMKTKYNVDLNRVYLTGFSMGGMMTYHAANNIADLIAAFAPVSGYMSTETNSSRPIPLIHTHGTADDVVPCAPGYSGSTGAWFPGCEAIAEGWAKRNNCDETPVTTSPYPVGKSGNTKKVYKNGDDGVEVVLITIDGKGHWHSNDPNAVHTTNEIWNFVKNYSLTGSRTNAAPAVAFTSDKSFTAPATIPITVDFSDPDEGDSVVHITYFNGDEQIVDKWVYPFAFTMDNMDAGTYTIAAVAYDTKGNSSSDTTVITVNPPQAPYSGTAHAIPGTIQCEDYDIGGNGFAYYDDSTGSETGVDFRTDEDVDIEVCTDTDGGYNIGYATAGEWLEYSVNVVETGVYDLTIRAACNADNRTISLESDGNDIAADVLIPNTTGWQEWTDVTVEDIQLTAGEQIIRLNIEDSNYVNLNYLTFTEKSTAVSAGLKYEMKGLAVYPNPLKETGVITVPNVENGTIVIYNSVGTVMTIFNGVTKNKILWSTTGITDSGVYTIVLNSQEEEYARIQVYVPE